MLALMFSYLLMPVTDTFVLERQVDNVFWQMVASSPIKCHRCGLGSRNGTKYGIVRQCLEIVVKVIS